MSKKTGVPGSQLVIGVDIGGTKIAAAAVDESGNILGTVHTLPTPVAEGRDAVLRVVVSLVRELHHQFPVAAVGIGSAGVFDSSGSVTSATSLLPGWSGTPLAEHVGSAVGLPAVAINDVHAAGIGEATYGAGVGYRNVLMVAVGTGIGGAVVREGTVEMGRTGTAGSLGHIAASWHPARACSCGALGHLEPLASGPGIEESYRELTGTRLSLREIAGAQDDRIARQVIADGAGILGGAIAGISNVVDPDIVVIGGGVAQMGGSYFATVVAAYRSHCLPGPADTPVVPAALGTRAAIVGAAVRARRA